ncbi:MAG: Spy/CpxP family protein refolding chaperone [Rhodocyclaceae bacterium]|nr:Spy/CpxP family protein refolding chaperone [Rhodocyclaceae bacterium]
MKINSKTVAALLATTALAFGVAAQAEPGAACEGQGPGGMHGMRMMGDPAARVDQHLSQFKSELKITPQQEPLWQAFADKVKTTAGAGMKAMRDNAQTPAPAPERMNRMIDIMKARTAAMESVNESFTRLYDGLTPEQKAIADKHGVFGGPMQRRGGPGAPKAKG